MPTDGNTFTEESKPKTAQPHPTFEQSIQEVTSKVGAGLKDAVDTGKQCAHAIGSGVKSGLKGVVKTLKDPFNVVIFPYYEFMQDSRIMTAGGHDIPLDPFLNEQKFSQKW